MQNTVTFICCSTKHRNIKFKILKKNYFKILVKEKICMYVMVNKSFCRNKLILSEECVCCSCTQHRNIKFKILKKNYFKILVKEKIYMYVMVNKSFCRNKLILSVLCTPTFITIRTTSDSYHMSGILFYSSVV
jgi:hypothetical protein